MASMRSSFWFVRGEDDTFVFDTDGSDVPAIDQFKAAGHTLDGVSRVLYRGVRGFDDVSELWLGKAGDCTPIRFVSVEKTDLWNDGYGWSGNYSWVRRAKLVVPANISRAALVRRILASVDAANCGFRRGGWLGTDLDWRCDCVGICAEFVS